MKCAVVATLVLAGCSNILGIDELHGSGGSSDGGTDGHAQDAAHDAPPGGAFRIAGMVQILDVGNPIVADGNDIEAIRLSDNVSLATSTVVQGHYTLDVPLDPDGLDLVVVLKAGTLPATQLDTSIYFPGRLSTDTTLDIIGFTRNGLQSLATASGLSQPQTASFAVVQALTEQNTGQAGATIAGPPFSPVRYLNSNGQPDPTLNQTSSLGSAFVFHVMPGMVTMQANLLTGGVQRTLDFPHQGVYYVPLRF